MSSRLYAVLQIPSNKQIVTGATAREQRPERQAKVSHLLPHRSLDKDDHTIDLRMRRDLETNAWLKIGHWQLVTVFSLTWLMDGARSSLMKECANGAKVHEYESGKRLVRASLSALVVFVDLHWFTQPSTTLNYRYQSKSQPERSGKSHEGD